MRLDFSTIEERMGEFLEYFKPEDKSTDNFYISLSQKDPEEGLFYLLLATHFDSSKSAKDFKLKWKDLKKSSRIDLEQICEEFFDKKISIGGHRRHVSYMGKKEKINYTLKILESYKKIIWECGSQSQFFEIDEKPCFDKLYEKMKQIRNFKPRLPRWDHLEKLSRTHGLYITPKRIYVEDSSGPRDGLTLLFFGERYRKMPKNRKKEFHKYLIKDFPKHWNQKVEDDYKITRELNNWKEVIPYLEKWAIDKIWQRLPVDKRTRAYLFDLETCLCNWQKRKKRPCS